MDLELARTAVGLVRAPNVTVERFEQSIGTLTNRSFELPGQGSVGRRVGDELESLVDHARMSRRETRPDNSCVMYLPSWSFRSLPQVEARCTMRRFSLYVHRQVPRKSALCLAYSWVRRFGVFGCRLVSPGSAMAIGSVKCERVWGSFVRAGAKNGARWSAFRGMGYACVPCARSKKEYFLRLARAARLATRATGRIRTRLKQQDL